MKQVHLMRWTIMYLFLFCACQFITQLKLFISNSHYYYSLYTGQHHIAVSNVQPHSAQQSSFDVQITATLSSQTRC